MKTNTLTGADLNRAVAMSLGHDVDSVGGRWIIWHRTTCSKPGCAVVHKRGEPIPDYAGDISVAWPIIKQFKVGMQHTPRGWAAIHGYIFHDRNAEDCLYDPDPQIAALRAIVHSVYGDDINLEE